MQRWPSKKFTIVMEKAGFKAVRQDGSHFLKEILKRTKISREEFFKLLREFEKERPGI